MDGQRDYPRFKNLVSRLCETLGKPMTDELLESWWKALRHVDFDTVSERVEHFLAKADEGTKFPRPAQMRPKNLAPRDPDQPQRDFVRDYWRSCIVNDCCRFSGYTIDGFERVLVEHAMLAASLRMLLDELCGQENQSGRTDGMHKGCRRRCEEIIGAYGVKELERA